MEPSRSNPSPPTGSTRLVLVAGLLAVLAVVLTNVYIERVRTQATESSFNAYVLARTVRSGDQLKSEYVKPVKVPEKFKDSFKDLGAMDEEDYRVRLADKERFQRSANAGDILTYAMFITPTGKDLDRNITTGRRMISLPINSRTAPGALHEGMYVDIEGAFHTGASVPETLPVMERVKVIALGTRTVYDEQGGSRRRRQSRSFKTITIEVTPDEATQLSMVQRITIGEFELHLRHPDDRVQAKIPEGGINPAVLQLIHQRRRQRAGEDAR